MSDGIELFYSLARERYSILLKKRAGMPAPWSEDPIFQNEYFCNVFREDDKTTTWFRENIRNPLDKVYVAEPEVVLRSIVAFRWFNRIETWRTILNALSKEGGKVADLFRDWDSGWVEDKLLTKGGPPWVTGAYIIKTPDGMSKLDGVFWCIDQFIKTTRTNHVEFDNLYNGNCTLQGACNLLQTAPYLGKFMAFQIVCDAMHTCLLEDATDINTWAKPGPGSVRGAGRVFYGDACRFEYGSQRDEEEIVQLFCRLLEYSKQVRFWPSEWPKWNCPDIQHFCCEVDKYLRAKEGGRMKRKYGNYKLPQCASGNSGTITQNSVHRDK